jgi:molecular chaperone HscB
MDALQQSFFQWFGLPERFAIDASALDSAFRAVQARVHPDRFTQALAAERRLAMQLATRANEAYQTLRDPVRRARYLCERHGVDVAIETNTSMPADFLMQQMQWREALDAAKATRTPDAFEALNAELRNERRPLLTALRAALDEAGDHAAAAALVRKLMFVERFAQELVDAQEPV